MFDGLSTVFELERLRQCPHVRDVLWQPETGSTNDWGTRRLSEGRMLDLPCLFVTDRQTAGRGRGRKSWSSAAGSLTFSVVIDPQSYASDPSAWPKLSLLTGLGVAEAVEELAPFATVGLKWPNDIYLDGGKVAGILLEVPPGTPPRVVVGIGVNVNTDVASLGGLDRPAMSIQAASGRSHDLTDVLLLLLEQLTESWSRLREPEFPLAAAWNERCQLSGRPVAVQAAEQTIVGDCLGIDDSGALLIDTPERIVRCTGGTVVEFG